LSRRKPPTASPLTAQSLYLANISHEIRTPIHALLGIAGLLQDTPLTAEQRDYVRGVDQSAQVLLAIVNDILDYSKIEAGKLDVERIDFDVRQTIEDAVDLLVPQARVKGLELAAIVHHDVPSTAGGDPGRLRQVLTNLVSNAIKFTDAGEVVVRVRLARQSAKTATVRVTVTDTGIGISPEAQARLFQPFAQESTATARRYGGTGLGLAISKQLTELMGGQIGVESVPGEGSTFWFTVRLQKRPDSVVALPLPRPDLRGLRVLAVDDNATNRAILQEQAASWGMDCVAVGTGAQALARLRGARAAAAPFDVALLDLQMGDMDGLELAEAIKADVGLASVPLVLLSSMGLRGQAARARQLDVAAYLTKPVRQAQLHDCLAHVLGLPAPAAAAPDGSALPLVTRHTLAEAHRRNRARVLVVENNPLHQKIAVRVLERLGYRVDVAGSGHEALAATANGVYAAVLMDCQMPDLDGFETTTRIRAREEHPRRTPIIAMTASALTGDRERCLAAGMDDYVSKPMDAATLASVLQRWVPRTNAEPDEVSPTPLAASEWSGAIDEDVLAGQRALEVDGAPGFLTGLIDDFLQVAPDQLAALRAAVKEEDPGALEVAAHSFKGDCGYLGARGMESLCVGLTALGRAGTTAGAEVCLEVLEQEFQRVKARLEAERARPAAARAS
jgi:two-component system, sensor histidine kinase and response regulator